MTARGSCRSSQTGQVIEGLRRHDQNTFGPTEGQNERWREANRRRQRQTIQHHGLVPTPPPPSSPPACPRRCTPPPQFNSPAHPPSVYHTALPPWPGFWAAARAGRAVPRQRGVPAVEWLCGAERVDGTATKGARAYTAGRAIRRWPAPPPAPPPPACNYAQDRLGYVGQQKQVAKTTHTTHTDTNKEPP